MIYTSGQLSKMLLFDSNRAEVLRLTMNFISFYVQKEMIDQIFNVWTSIILLLFLF